MVLITASSKSLCIRLDELAVLFVYLTIVGDTVLSITVLITASSKVTVH